MTNTPNPKVRKRDASELASAFEHLDDLLKDKTPAVFLDYDGCLTPITSQPEQAILSAEMKSVLQQLATLCPVAVVSGRDRQNVQDLVKLNELYFAGSHGFDIEGPNGMKTEPGGAADALPALEQADKLLTQELKDVKGALVERKRYAIAVHFRNVAETDVPKVKEAVNDALERYPQLKKGLGKKIYELKPNLDWHKGKAVLWLLKELKLDKPAILPIYIGDDITDEDAFAELQGRGVGILVGEHDDRTAATYKLEDVDEVQQFLQQLADKLKV